MNFVWMWLVLAATAADGAATEKNAAVATKGKRVLLVVTPKSTNPAQDMQKALDEHTKKGDTVLSPDEVFTAGTGTPEPKTPTTEEIEALRKKANDLNADWRTALIVEKYNELIEVYDHALRPNQKLRELAAFAYHAQAVAYAADEKTPKIDQLLRESARRFPQISPDPIAFAPKFQTAFDKQKQALDRGPKGTLRIKSTLPGELWADGHLLAKESVDSKPRSLPVGRYRVWVDLGEGRMSWPHVVELTPDANITVNIDVGLETCLEFGPPLTLTCADGLESHLKALREIPGIDEVVALPVEAKPGGTKKTDDDKKTGGVGDGGAVAMPTFHPIYLVPLTVAQFYQGSYDSSRYYYAATYLTLDVLLVAWHVVAQVMWNDVRSGSNSDLTDAWGQQVTISAIAAGSFVLLTYIEGLVWGAVAGD